MIIRIRKSFIASNSPVSGEKRRRQKKSRREGFIWTRRLHMHHFKFEGKTSFRMSVFNLSNTIMGSGILGLAYAMTNSGIIFFVVLLIFIAILSTYFIHLLLKSAGVVGIRACAQLWDRACAQTGKILAACIITLHNIGDLKSGTAVQCAIIESISALPKLTMTRRKSLDLLPVDISSSSGHLADDLQCSSDLSRCVH